jgi:nitrite reductase (NADH) small subunit
MSNYIDVASIDELIEGAGRAFPVAGKMIAIFFIDHELFAIDDFCPHMGASLGDGQVRNGCVACPWHAWEFQLKDGCFVENPKLRAATYHVKMEGNRVLVDPTPKTNATT